MNRRCADDSSSKLIRFYLSKHNHYKAGFCESCDSLQPVPGTDLSGDVPVFLVMEFTINCLCADDS